MKIMIINGPKPNQLGKRQPEIYGHVSFDSYLEILKQDFPAIDIVLFQSDVEHEVVDMLQEADADYDGIILNAGRYTHTSERIGDTVKAIETPVIEVHISNIFAREEFRHISYISPHAKGIIAGLGLDVYRLAIMNLSN